MVSLWLVWHCVLSADASLFFFFNDTATTEIYTLSLHDALPIFLSNLDQGRTIRGERLAHGLRQVLGARGAGGEHLAQSDRKSTRLNSSHLVISYAVFCLKKKNNNYHTLYQSHDSSVSSNADHVN